VCPSYLATIFATSGYLTLEISFSPAVVAVKFVLNTSAESDECNVDI
jgi:hypothetical protein